jgi:hypothetical protein
MVANAVRLLASNPTKTSVRLNLIVMLSQSPGANCGKAARVRFWTHPKTQEFLRRAAFR